MSTKTLTAAVLAASLSGVASAGVLTLTASSTTGFDEWMGLTGYTMSLTIDCSTMNDVGSSSSFTLNNWTFMARDSAATVKFLAEGSNLTFSAAPGTGKFIATIGLNPSNILINAMVPVAESISFSYAFSGTESLLAAIEASAGTTNGELSLGTDRGATGELSGIYATPAPGVAVLLGLGGLISRRRKA